MTAFKLYGEWEIKLVPHIVKMQKNGLTVEHDMKQDRVIVTQGKISRQVAWWNHQCKAILPLSGMIHPDDVAEMQTRILGQIGLDPAEWPEPPVIVDPGRNNKEQEYQDTPEDDEDDES